MIKTTNPHFSQNRVSRVFLPSQLSNFEHDCLSHWIGDGSCDDINNYSWCQYDNGDCCVKSGYENIWNDFCTECLCKSNETNYPSSLETHKASPFKLIE